MFQPAARWPCQQTAFPPENDGGRPALCRTKSNHTVVAAEPGAHCSAQFHTLTLQGRHPRGSLVWQNQCLTTSLACKWQLRRTTVTTTLRPQNSHWKEGAREDTSQELTFSPVQKFRIVLWNPPTKTSSGGLVHCDDEFSRPHCDDGEASATGCLCHVDVRRGAVEAASRARCQGMAWSHAALC